MEYAPNLLAFMAQYDIRAVPAPPDPNAAVQRGDLDVVLVIPPAFGAQFLTARPAQLQLIQDSSRRSASVTVSRVQRALDAYSAQIRIVRLLARGVNPTSLTALRVETIDVASQNVLLAVVLGMLPAYVMFAVFISGLFVATDTTAGERERGSLEPLLINPVSRTELVAGKLAATMVFALLGVAATLLAFGVLLNTVPLERFLGARISLSPLALGGIFLLAAPVVALAAALELLLATFSRSVKEAQSYISFLVLIPFLPGFLLAFAPVRPDIATMLIPTFSQQLLISQVLREEPLDPLLTLISILATIAAAAIATIATIRLYRSERVL
jgi:sodium transport system permease protein